MTQSYDTYVEQEHVIRGNVAIMKCKVPSFVADFLEVTSWHDNLDNVYVADGKNHGAFETRNTHKIPGKSVTVARTWL